MADELWNKPRGVFSGYNFMTPEVVSYFRLENGYAELSRGRGMTNNTIWGVTIKKASGAAFDPDRSGCFSTRAEAMERIEAVDIFAAYNLDNPPSWIGRVYARDGVLLGGVKQVTSVRFTTKEQALAWAGTIASNQGACDPIVLAHPRLLAPEIDADGNVVPR